MVSTDEERQHCSIEISLELIGGKWKGVILFHLLEGKKRFSELRRLIPHVSQRMLTRQLRDLERSGLVLRTVYPVVPPKVEYELTKSGMTLKPILLALMDWGNETGRGILSGLKGGA